MSSSEPTRPLRLPLPDLAQRALPHSRLAARTWYRVHSASHKAISFGLNPAHRFSHPTCPYRFLYLGADLETCLWERFGDTVFDQDHRVLKALWMSISASAIQVPRLSVCDFGSTGMRNALNVDMTALMSYDLSVSQAWGLAIQQHPAKFASIKFNSRFTNRPCLAVFDRNDLPNALTEKRTALLADSDQALDWLEKFGIQLV
jgi:RES domain-containing protein